MHTDFYLSKTSDINGKALVLDLGGTNYRVATVDLGQGSPTIHPNNGWKKDMSIMKSRDILVRSYLKN